jgi:Na+-driven multidrug efflux pump
MASVAIGAFLNLILDYILIFHFYMGVKGAAIATVISQAVSAFWVMGFLCSKRSSLRVRPEIMRPSWKIMVSIGALGIAPFVMDSTESLVNIVLNNGLRAYGGELYIGSLAIMMSVKQIIAAIPQGITKGAQPIMSYNYGAKNYLRVRKTFSLVLTICVAATVVCCAAVTVFPGQITYIFTPDEELISLVSVVMPIFFGGFWIFGTQWTCQATFVATGQARTSLFLALFRKFVLLIPLAIILPKAMNSVMGIFIAEAIADAVSSSSSLVLFYARRKSILPLPGQEQQ